MPLPYILLTGFYCFLIFQNSSVSDPLPPDIDLPFGDKFAHFVVYGGLCGLVAIGLSRPPRRVDGWTLAAVPILFTVAYGMTDEIHQLYVPGRSFELADLLADAGGAIAVQAILLVHWRNQRAKQRSALS